MGLFTRSHRIPPATASIQCLETHDHFPRPVPRSCVLHECVCVAVAESVRSFKYESRKTNNRHTIYFIAKDPVNKGMKTGESIGDHYNIIEAKQYTAVRRA